MRESLKNFQFSARVYTGPRNNWKWVLQMGCLW